MSANEELSASERAALTLERDRGEPAGATQERMRRRLQIAMAVASPVPPPPTPGLPAAKGGGELASLARSVTRRTAVAAALGALVGGGAVGIALRAREEASPETKIVSPGDFPGSYVERDAEVSAPAPSAIPLPTAPAASTAATPLPSLASPPPRGRTAPPPSDTLTAETNLLDAARAALARGDGDDAVRVLEQHARRFPASTLREEREALLVPALMQAHRAAEAEAKAKAFRQQFPKSVFLRSVESALPQKE